ncbi:MAG: demethoxyubiquinone hydroxylase family protein [Candidatus Paracaedibacteraceae bacterium]|nr:demethoxyubiquinone hydroxylase family protein [Candidatus Paracaedibacteraceae bacterium]
MKKKDIHQIVRVNHAGELGAKWIYQGQLDWIKDAQAKEIIRHMYEQELDHLKYFEKVMQVRQVRPTILMPFWKWVGKTAGAFSAALGSDAAMACTEAVEDVIDEHYASQIRHLEKERPDEIELINTLKTFRADECNHRDIAATYDQSPSPLKRTLKKAVKIGVKLAISVSKRI